MAVNAEALRGVLAVPREARPVVSELPRVDIKDAISKLASENLRSFELGDQESFLTETGRLSQVGSRESRDLLERHLEGVQIGHPLRLQRTRETTHTLKESRGRIKRELKGKEYLPNRVRQRLTLEGKMVSCILRQAKQEETEALITLHLNRMIADGELTPLKTGCETRRELVAKVRSLHHCVARVFCPRQHLQGSVYRYKITSDYIAGLATLDLVELSFGNKKVKGVRLTGEKILTHPFFAETKAVRVMREINKTLRQWRKKVELPLKESRVHNKIAFLEYLLGSSGGEIAFQIVPLMLELREVLPGGVYFNPRLLAEDLVGKTILRLGWQGDQEERLKDFWMSGQAGREVLDPRLAKEAARKEKKERLKHKARLALATAVGPMVAAGLLHFGPKLDLAQGEKVIPGFLAGIALSQLAIRHEHKNGNVDEEKLKVLRRFRESMIIAVAIMAASSLDSTKIEDFLRSLSSWKPSWRFPEEELFQGLDKVVSVPEIALYRLLRKIPWEKIGEYIRHTSMQLTKP